MNSSITLCTLQWGDLSLEEICQKAKVFGFDGLELCVPFHVDVRKTDSAYYQGVLEYLSQYGLQLSALSNFFMGQVVCDPGDSKHKAYLPDYIWGNGEPEGVRARGIESLIQSAYAAKALGVGTVSGFTGSSIWHQLYAYPGLTKEIIAEGYRDFAEKFKPILDEYQKLGIRYALEVHPTEIAFDTCSAQQALEALDYHPAFGFNYDPSHLGFQGVDYIDFIHSFPDRIFHVHLKDVDWDYTPGKVGFWGGNLPIGDPRRPYHYCNIGQGKIKFDKILEALDEINYQGALSIEWEDNETDRESGTIESLRFLKELK